MSDFMFGKNRVKNSFYRLYGLTTIKHGVRKIVPRIIAPVVKTATSIFSSVSCWKYRYFFFVIFSSSLKFRSEYLDYLACLMPISNIILHGEYFFNFDMSSMCFYQQKKIQKKSNIFTTNFAFWSFPVVYIHSRVRG